jgi:putative FmdB family regulatory protein
MPTYDFECKQCGAQFSEKQSFEEHDHHKKVKCPQCGSLKVEQLISSAFVVTAKKS